MSAIEVAPQDLTATRPAEPRTAQRGNGGTGPRDAVPSIDEILAAARAIVPRLEASSARSEKLRRLDDDAAAAMREAGLVRLFTPKRYGGYELAPRAHILACAELARGDSAASWVLMVCGAHTYVVGRYPEECQREIFENGPDVLIAGTLAPQGTAERVDGGWVLDGRWQFGSGCDHSPWLLIGARVTNPEADPSHTLAIHSMVPASDIDIDDTWFTLGMRGTGSKDLVAKKVFVPAHRAMPTYPLFVGSSPHASSPVYRLPVLSGLAAMLSATVLGIAERGFERFVDRTKGRKDVQGASKAASASMQRRVAESAAELGAARRLLEDLCDRFDAAIAAGRLPMSAPSRASIRWDAAYVVELSRRAIDRLFAAAGAHAVYDPSEMQRVHRDIHTASHHAIVDFDSLAETVGRAALGIELAENECGVPIA